MNINIDLVFKNYTSQKAPGREFFKKILEMAAKELKIRDKIGVSINLVGEKRVRELNKKYRHKNKPTDVLSFPTSEGLEIKNSKLLGKGSRAKPGISVEIEKDIGDVFLCLSIAKNEAKRENINIKDKLAQLTVHGFLHLQGYDHERSEKEAEKMFGLEQRILKNRSF